MRRFLFVAKPGVQYPVYAALWLAAELPARADFRSDPLQPLTCI